MIDACGGADNLLLSNIGHYVDPHVRTTMLSRLYMHRNDLLRQAEELAQLAHSAEINTHAKNPGRDVINAVEPRKDPKDTVKAKAKATFKEGDELTCCKAMITIPGGLRSIMRALLAYSGGVSRGCVRQHYRRIGVWSVS